jgi:hypothetical protein
MQAGVHPIMKTNSQSFLSLIGVFELWMVYFPFAVSSVYSSEGKLREARRQL